MAESVSGRKVRVLITRTQGSDGQGLEFCYGELQNSRSQSEWPDACSWHDGHAHDVAVADELPNDDAGILSDLAWRAKLEFNGGRDLGNGRKFIFSLKLT